MAIAILDQSLPILDFAGMKPASPAVRVDPTRSRYASFETSGNARLPQVVFAGFETVLPDYRVDRESFPTFAIELVRGGRGALQMNGVSHSLQPGSIFTYGPGVAHLITSDRRSPLRKYFIDLAPAPPCHGPDGLAAGLVFATPMGDRLASLLDGILDDSSAGIDLPGARGDATRLFLALAGHSHRTPQPPACAAYSRYLQVKAHIEANYHLSGCVGDHARALRIDPSYLTRLFQRFGNESPYPFLTRLRLDRARQLLLRDDLSIQQISDTLHFANPFHFSALFRRHHGIAPSAVRLRALKGT
jgi:AraC-like DNA-binding protein/quercetin dioxygenase-like cupin family protein